MKSSSYTLLHLSLEITWLHQATFKLLDYFQVFREAMNEIEQMVQ